MIEKTKISAQIIADSLNPQGDRCTTFLLVFPRPILAELNTHRMFSRNSASSRAIPFPKMMKKCIEDPFIPMKWMRNHKGMQNMSSNPYFTEPYEINSFTEDWLLARDRAVKSAEKLFLGGEGLTKQMCNRLLEPFMWHTAIVTATEWENFFSLRAHPAAEIHVQELANQMLGVYNDSTPKQLKAGEWHVPFGDNIEFVGNLTEDIDVNNKWWKDYDEQNKVKIATARIAKLSYNNLDGSSETYTGNIKLHNKLFKMGHWSCFEHSAKAMTDEEYMSYHRGQIVDDIMTSSTDKGWCGNFKGFIQYRKMFEGENGTDERVLKK